LVAASAEEFHSKMLERIEKCKYGFKNFFLFLAIFIIKATY